MTRRSTKRIPFWHSGRFGRRSPVRAIVAAVLVAGLMTSCSSSGSSTSGIDLSTLDCTSAQSSGLGDGEVCVDSGIRADNLFSFANWAGRRYKADDFGIAEMIAIYGKDAVCKDSKATNCQVTPKARVLQSAITSMLLSGRCEGLTVLGALYMAKRGPDLKQFNASTIQQLSPSNEDFGNLIDYWWSTQFLEDIVRQSKESKSQGVSGVLSTVIKGLQSLNGVTIGIYSESGAHSLLPVAVTRLSDKEFRIIVWDSNNPRQLTKLTIDTSTKTWKYEGGRINPNQPPKVWSGSDGTIDATSIDTRQGKPVLKIGDGQKGDATVLATSGTSQKLEVTVETSAGEKLVATSTGTTGAIPGAAVTPLKNGDADQLLITLPESAGAFTASVKTTAKDTATPTGSTQLTVENGSANAFAISVPATDEAANLSVEATPAANGLSTFSGQANQASKVTASTESSVIAVDTSPNDVIKVATSTSQNVDASITISGADGSTQVANVPATGGNTAVQDVVISKTEGGRLRVTTAVAAAVPIDSKKIESLVSTAAKPSSSEGTGFSEISSDALNTDLQASVTRTSATTGNITARITSPVDTSAWIEYGPDLDWNKLERTPTRTVKAQTTDDLSFELTGLSAGTKYRFRLTANISGTLKSTTFNQFITSGESVFTSAMAAAEVIEASATVAEVTLSSATFTSLVTTKSNTRTWLEITPVSSPGAVRRTDPTPVVSGQTLRTVTEVKNLADGEIYQYRVVINVRGVLVFSRFQEFTTASKPKIETISSAISLDTGSVSETGASVVATISTPAPVTVQVFYGIGTASTLLRSIFVSSGSNTKLEFSLAELTAGTQYVVRAVLPVDQKPSITATLNLTTAAAGSVVRAPELGTVGQTKALFKLTFPTRVSGRLRLEWGLDRSNFEATSFAYADITTSTQELTIDTADIGPLLPGSKYKVRAVLVKDDGVFTSTFTNFTTSGTINDSVLYRPTAPTIVATTGQFVVQWTMSLKDVPSNVTFRVFDGTTQLCQRPSNQWACTVLMQNPTITSVVVVSYVDGVEIARSPATTAFTP